MKATGIVRRIDDLGRVVVPKEIRRTLRIREGDPLEIFTDREGEIILKKYSPIGELSIFAKQYAEAMAQTTGLVAVIADRDQFIAVAGNGKKDLLAKAVSKELEDLMTERESLVATKGDKNFISLNTFYPSFYWPLFIEIIKYSYIKSFKKSIFFTLIYGNSFFTKYHKREFITL